MAKMIFDEDGYLEEPCLSCDNAYLEDIWTEWCCDEKECPHKPESEEKLRMDSDHLLWECEHCGKLIPYMAAFCNECMEKLLGEPPKPIDLPEREEN